MKSEFFVMNPFTVKGGKLIEAGSVVKIDSDKVAPLVQSGKLKPLQAVFDDLFHEHILKMKRYSLLPAEIKSRDPEAYEAIQTAIRQMDDAWLQGNLSAFKTAMGRTEEIYLAKLKEFKCAH